MAQHNKTHGLSGSHIGSEYTLEQLSFMLALDRWKRLNHCVYPSWAQVLAVSRALGYRLVAAPVALPVYHA